MIITSLLLLPIGIIALLTLLRAHAMNRPVAILGAVLSFALVGRLYFALEQSAAHQITESLLGVELVVDGLSLLFMASTALITLLLVLNSISRSVNSPALLRIGLFAAQSAMMGLFSTTNLLGFILLLLVQTIIVGMIMWHWSRSPEKEAALTRYYQFMAVSLLLLSGGAFVAAWSAGSSGLSFDLPTLLSRPLDTSTQALVFFALFYGFAIRTPIFPFHGWLIPAVQQGDIVFGPTLLLGAKVGIYGLLRFVLPLAPDAVQQWSPFAVALSVFGVFYAAILAMMQRNLRGLAGYAVLSHTSVIIVGIFTLHPLALKGSVMLSVTYGLAITALFLVISHIHARTHTTNLDRLGGLFSVLPFSAILFGMGSLALAGMPGTPGFDAIHLVLEGGVEHFGALVTVATALGNVVVAAFLLRAFQQAFLGETSTQPSERNHTAWLERLVVVLMIMTLVGTGFFVAPWLELIAAPMEQLAAAFIEPTTGGHQ